MRCFHTCAAWESEAWRTPNMRAPEAAGPRALLSPLEVKYSRRLRAALPVSSLILPAALALHHRFHLISSRTETHPAIMCHIHNDVSLA